MERELRGMTLLPPNEMFSDDYWDLLATVEKPGGACDCWLEGRVFFKRYEKLRREALLSNFAVDVKASRHQTCPTTRDHFLQAAQCDIDHLAEVAGLDQASREFLQPFEHH